MGDGGSISAPIGDEDLRLSTLNTKPKHASNAVHQSAGWTRCSGVVFERLYSSNRHWRRAESRNHREGKQHCVVGSLSDEFLDEVIPIRGKSRGVVENDKEVVPRRVPGPGRRCAR